MPFEITNFILGSTSFPANLHNIKVVVVFVLFGFFCCIGLYRVFKLVSLWFAYSNRNVVRLSGQYLTVQNITHPKVVEKVRDSVTHHQITSQCTSVSISGHLVSERPKFQGIKSEEASFEPSPRVFTSTSSGIRPKTLLSQPQTDSLEKKRDFISKVDSEISDRYEIIPGHNFGFEDEKVIQFASRNLHLSMILECSAAVSMQVLCGVPVSSLNSLVRNTSLRPIHIPSKEDTTPHTLVHTTTQLSDTVEALNSKKMKAENSYTLGESIELTKSHSNTPPDDLVSLPVLTLKCNPEISLNNYGNTQRDVNETQNCDQSSSLFQPENGLEVPIDLVVVEADPESAFCEVISSIDTKKGKQNTTISSNNRFDLDNTTSDLLVRKALFSLGDHSLYRGFPMLIRPLPRAEHQEVMFSIPVSMIAHTVERYNAGEAVYPLVFLLQPMTESGKKENNARQAEITVAAFTDPEEAKLSDFTAGKIQVEGQFILLGKDLLQLLPTYGIWDKDDSLECTVCLTDYKDVIFIPCRHIAVCRFCNKHVTKCPLCRVSVRSFVIFVNANTEGEDIYAKRTQ